MTYTQVVEISGESQNQVEQAIHELNKSLDDARRYGVEINLRRVDVSDKNVEGFDND